MRLVQVHVYSAKKTELDLYMKRTLISLTLGLLCASCSPRHETMMEGPYSPTWELLSQYGQNFFDRNVDMMNRYNPDLVYYDDTSMPLWPVSDAGLRAVVHLYNKSVAENAGANQAVVFAKILTDDQKNALVWDVEKGVPDTIQEKPWQTCTCLGAWHYDRSIYERDRYKSVRTVVHMLIDIVSKNGNMLLSVPQRGDGSIDEKERKILEEIAAWMVVNSEGIYGTRPWKIFGEGPVAEGSTLREEPVGSVMLAGHDTLLAFERTAEGLVVTLPGEAVPAGGDTPDNISLQLKIS